MFHGLLAKKVVGKFGCKCHWRHYGYIPRFPNFKFGKWPTLVRTITKPSFKHLSLREKCPNTEFFLLRISLYSDWIRRSPYSVRIRENTDQKTFVYGHFTQFTKYRTSVIEIIIPIFLKSLLQSSSKNCPERKVYNFILSKCRNIGFPD